MATLKNWMLEAIKDELDNLDEGREIIGAEFAYELFESYNIDGSYTYSTYEAKEWIKEYFDELGEIVEEIQDNLGAECVPNVFDNPEAFMVAVILEYTSGLLAQCEIIEDNWNDGIIITNEVVNKIKKELDEI